MGATQIRCEDQGGGLLGEDENPEGLELGIGIARLGGLTFPSNKVDCVMDVYTYTYMVRVYMWM